MDYHRAVRRWVFRLAVAVVLLAAAAVVYFVALRPDPVPVTVYLAARGRVEETVTNSKAGTVKARRRARVSPELGGRVAELPVRAGDRVKAGDVLVRIEDSQYRAQVQNAERALEAAREGEKEACLSMSQAGRDLARAETLAKDQIISAEMIDQARSRRDIARAACDASRARTRGLDSQLQAARDELAKTVVRAPFDAVVAELKTERGEWVMPSPPGIPMPAVLDLIDTDPIYVSAPLDEVDSAKVSTGQPVRITMDAYSGRSFPGRITRVAPYIEDLTEQSRTFEVEATFDDADFARTLPPGASADIEVILSARENVMRIPTYALLEGKRVLVLDRECAGGGGGGGRWLGSLVSGGGGCLVSKDVGTGLRNWEFAEITGGVKEGERVVVSLDRAEVKEGARARQSAVTEK